MPHRHCRATPTREFLASGQTVQCATLVWYLRKFGRRRPKYIRNGEWVRAKLAEVLTEKDIAPIGRGLFSMSCLPEMAELIGRFKDCDGVPTPIWRVDVQQSLDR
jgi:hypothetical protein